MCGLTGFYQPLGFNSDWAESVVTKMSDALSHRGPDDSGIWIEKKDHIALAHRRLSIIDLSSAGHQPMESHSGRYILLFNGEIYNHQDMQKRLLSDGIHVHWKGHSDTEILLACIDARGLIKTIQETVGMFAMAVLDRKDHILYLIRDRMGEKPLYYGWNNGVFFFGSELKAIKKHPSFTGLVDRDSLVHLLHLGYIPTPHSIYQNIHKLSPGCFIALPCADKKSTVLPKPQTYWDIQEMIQPEVQFNRTYNEATETLIQLIRNSIRQQCVADVPVGVFLSGGIDSSLIAAIAQEQSIDPIKTFSIGFHEHKYNEAGYAKTIAKHLRTNHTELYCTPDDVLNIIPRLPQIYDEPFADSSQIPTRLLTEMTRKQVKVALTGDGGDELFGGYTRYLFLKRYSRITPTLSPSLKKLISRCLTLLSPKTWDSLSSVIGTLILPSFQVNSLGEKVHKLAQIMLKNGKNIYIKYSAYSGDSTDIVINGNEREVLARVKNTWLKAFATTYEKMIAIDTMLYLPDDILVKVDRASMNVSLETRIPLLDHRIVEFAGSLPLGMNMHSGKGKQILRSALRRYVPDTLFDRPKQGFGIPLNDWLCGPLRDWAEELLRASRLRQEGFLRPAPIRKLWQDHISNRNNSAGRVWSILMFQAWLENEKESKNIHHGDIS